MNCSSRLLCFCALVLVGCADPTSTTARASSQPEPSSRLHYLPAPAARAQPPVAAEPSAKPEVAAGGKVAGLPKPIQPTPSPKAKAPPGKASAGVILDSDLDGHVSLAEANAAAKALDKNGDGSLDRGEKTAARALVRETNKALRLKLLDLDRNGRVSPEEKKQSQAAFDVDHDGQLSPAELARWRLDWKEKAYDRGARGKLTSK